MSEEPQDMTGQHKERPAENAFAVTPSTAVLKTLPRGVYVGGAGDVVCEMREGIEVTFTNMLAGVVHPIRPKKILAATTATGIVAVY